MEKGGTEGVRNKQFHEGVSAIFRNIPELSSPARNFMNLWVLPAACRGWAVLLHVLAVVRAWYGKFVAVVLIRVPLERYFNVNRESMTRYWRRAKYVTRNKSFCWPPSHHPLTIVTLAFATLPPSNVAPEFKIYCTGEIIRKRRESLRQHYVLR